MRLLALIPIAFLLAACQGPRDLRTDWLTYTQCQTPAKITAAPQPELKTLKTQETEKGK